jgi:hypothetical protein
MKFNIIAILLITFLVSAGISAQSEWSGWKQTSCMKGLDYRLQNTGNKFSGKTEWKVQFRNRYYKKIHFSCDITPPNQNSTLRDRLSLSGNNGVKGTYFYVNSSFRVTVHIGRIRFGTTDNYSTEYVSCDN